MLLTERHLTRLVAIGQGQADRDKLLSLRVPRVTSQWRKRTGASRCPYAHLPMAQADRGKPSPYGPDGFALGVT